MYPKELERYYIYGRDIVSSCTGIVEEAENNFIDLTPPESDPENPLGNSIKLTCDHHEADVYIAHMQEESVVVEAGDKVEKGEHIGIVGNSGNTSEPYVNIHAE